MGIFPSQETSGGILVGWNATLCFKLDIHLISFSLSLKFKNPGYLHAILSSNWVIGGDFNVIRLTHEYSNSSSVSPIMTNFNNFIASTNFIVVSPNNYLYTWSNFQQNATMVKLDRFLISPG